MATVHDHRWTEPDAERWPNSEQAVRLAAIAATALAPLRGRAPAGLEQSRSSHGAGECCDPFAPCDACSEADQFEEAQAATLFNRIEEIH